MLGSLRSGKENSANDGVTPPPAALSIDLGTAPDRFQAESTDDVIGMFGHGL